MKITDISAPDYFHKVVDCQWACPAHTPVPEYIRLIAHGRYSDAYMVNWRSNVFPGILGRTCDRPCEPACRRVRVEKEPVAICRLKRVAADYKDDIRDRLPKPAAKKNGKRIALVGGGPASLTVARDLLTDSGSIFVQIGDENLHLVRGILDEVFGSGNFVSMIGFRKTATANSPLARLNTLGSVSDYLVWYAICRSRVWWRYTHFSRRDNVDTACFGHYKLAV